MAYERGVRSASHLGRPVLSVPPPRCGHCLHRRKTLETIQKRKREKAVSEGRARRLSQMAEELVRKHARLQR